MSADDFSFIKWGDNGLLPAIVQDAGNAQVLMQAWMNQEALRRTIADGYATFWSRSRSEIWKKGESSGHFLKLVDIYVDCDADCILLQAIPVEGIACHTGTASCFNRKLDRNDRQLSEHPSGPEPLALAKLEQTIARRADADPATSYTASLLSAGPETILRKVGEEALELVLAAQSKDKQRIVEESADLWYHVLVLLKDNGVSLHQVHLALDKRSGQSGLEEKASRDGEK